MNTLHKKTFILYTLLFVVFGYFSWHQGFITGQKSVDSNTVDRNALSSDTNGQALPAAAGMISAEGIIDEINENIITLHLINALPGAQSTIIKKVEITADSALTKITKRDSATLEAEMIEFHNKMSSINKNGNQDVLPNPPVPFLTEKIDVSQLKKDDQVLVTADSDISNSETFKAVSLQLQPKSEMPTTISVPTTQSTQSQSSPIPTSQDGSNTDPT